MIRKAVFVFLIYFSLGIAQNPGCTGGIGLLHTHSALVFDPGQLGSYTNMNFYSKHPTFIDQSTSTDTPLTNLWFIAGNSSLTCGIAKHIDFTAALRLYQDVNYSRKKKNIPDDIFLTLKFGSFSYTRNRLYTSFMFLSRIATGEFHNYPYAEYASGAFEYGLTAAISYYSDPYFLDRSISFHYNVGFWNHNEKGSEVTLINKEKRIYTVNSTHLQMALATIIPSGLFNFRFEISGILYLKRPDSWVLSAEEWSFFTPSLRLKASKIVSMDFGMDIRLNPGDRQWTHEGPDDSEIYNLPKNVPPWKIHLGINLHILPLGGKKKKHSTSFENRELEQKIEFYQVLKEEENKSKRVESEVKVLKNARRSADSEIDELRKRLEEE